MQPPVQQPSSWYEVLEPHLTATRLAPYLAVAGGNRRDAVRLYQWNIDLSGAVYQALHIVEVVLRNAIDSELGAWNARQVDNSTGSPRGTEWLLDPAPLLRRLIRPEELSKAHNRATVAIRPQRRPVTHGDLLAQLSFGTWRYLLPDKDAGRQLLWREAIHRAFPHLTTDPATLVRKVDGIHQLRNRVAHLEPLLRMAIVREQCRNMRDVLSAIDPEVERWFVSNQRVTAVLRTRPGQSHK